MDQALAEQIRYLELRLEECSSRPAMHRQQIAAYRGQLQVAKNSGSALDYLREMTATGTTMAVVRAEWIDRYRNWGCIYRTLGDDVRARTADASRRAAEDIAGDAGFMVALMSVKARGAVAEHRTEANQRGITSLVSALLDWRVTGHPNLRQKRAQTVKTLWATMRVNDPAWTWRRLCTYPPYRQRLPFSAGKLQLLEEWLIESVGPDIHATASASHEDASPALELPPADTDMADTEMVIPSAQQAALGYRATYAALDKEDPANRTVCDLYEQVFELEAIAASGPAFLRAMAENDLYCRIAMAPQLALARRGLQRCKERSQPHAEYHYRELEQALLTCRSPTEVDYEVERASRMFAVEVAWNDILLSIVARVLAAVSGYVAEPDQLKRDAVAASHRAACDAFGSPWSQILASPRIWDMFERVWFAEGGTLSAREPGGIGALFGEVGGAAVPQIREATVQKFVELGTGDKDRPVFANPEAMRAYLDAGLRRALTDAPTGFEPARAESSDQAPFSLWGRPVSLAHLHDALGQPNRPHVALDVDL